VTGLIAIARREITERWIVLVVALVLGWLPIAAAVIERVAELPLAAPPLVLYLASRAICIVAFVIGMSLIGRQLHGGQSTFWFSRPISAPAIALGQVLGVALVVIAAQCLVLAPTAWWYGLQATSPGPERGWVLYDFESFGARDLVGAMLLLGAGLTAGVLARSRSRWFALDLAGLTAVGLVMIRVVDQISSARERYWIHFNGRWQRPWELAEAQRVSEQDIHLMRLAEARFETTVDGLWAAIAIAIAVALFAAVVAAVARGRTDGRRAHGALSTTLWSSLVAVAASGLAVAHWGLR
jgi:hypothetical protein